MRAVNVNKSKPMELMLGERRSLGCGSSTNNNSIEVGYAKMDSTTKAAAEVGEQRCC